MSEPSSSYSSMNDKSSLPNPKKLKKGRVLQAVWSQIKVDSDVLWKQVQEKSTALYNEYIDKKESAMEPMEHEMTSMDHDARSKQEKQQEQLINDGDDKRLLRDWKQEE